MGMCFNRKVLIGLAAVAVGVVAVAPRMLGAILPVLVLAACPLSMIVMMRAMNRGKQPSAACAAQTETAAHDETTPAGQPPRSTEAELRELHEEVNRLRAELRLRDPQSRA